MQESPILAIKVQGHLGRGPILGLLRLEVDEAATEEADGTMQKLSQSIRGSR